MRWIGMAEMLTVNVLPPLALLTGVCVGAVYAAERWLGL
jgi:hypothetical protein